MGGTLRAALAMPQCAFGDQSRGITVHRDTYAAVCRQGSETEEAQSLEGRRSAPPRTTILQLTRAPLWSGSKVRCSIRNGHFCLSNGRISAAVDLFPDGDAQIAAEDLDE